MFFAFVLVDGPGDFRAHDTLSNGMSEPETVAGRRFLWPADYYSGPAPRAVLPRGVTYGCGAVSLVALLLIFAGGVFMASGGLVQFMDLALGMSMGEVRGMYTADVTPAQKKELETAMETLRKGIREEKISVAKLDPVLQSMRRGIADQKMQPSEVDTVTAAARMAARPPITLPKRP